MDIRTNYIICAALLFVTVIVVTIIIIKNSKKDDAVMRKEYKTLWDVVDMFKDYMVEMLNADLVEDASDEEFERLYRRVAKIRTANKQATFGMDGAKALIKDIAANAIEDTLLDTEIDNILGMGPGQMPSVTVMFEAIMQNYKLRYGKSAMAQWINNYKLAEARLHGGVKRYYISIDDVYNTYQEEHIEFSHKEKVRLLATLVYQLYRGFGVIDTIREMNIDGLNIGTSGSILSNLEGNTVQSDPLKPEEEATRGCWLYFKGRYIHLRFINFGSEDEIKRIVNLLVRYNSSGSLTAKRGYMVNTMYDKSRLLAFRPPVAEYWAAFIRKFTLSSITLDSLIIKDNVTNGEFARDTIKFIMWGLATSLITGRQGSGKTTMMSAAIEYIDPAYNIRVLEMAPELYLRELYKDRNILSAQETQHVSASEIQNAFKKSDSAMSICGEIATSALACRWLEFARVASIMNLATHHANTTHDLVIALANNLVDEMHTTIDAAIQQVVDLLKFDVHLDYTKEGFRYIERISEVVPANSEPYDKFKPNFPNKSDYDSLAEYEVALKEYEVKLQEYNALLNREYYTRVTDRQSFVVNQLLHFDLESMSYVADNPPSPALVERMKRNMSSQQIKEFDKYLLENYEIRDADELVIDLTEDKLTNNETGEVTDLNSEDLDIAEEMLGELQSKNSDQTAQTEGLIDMADAIDAVRHTGNSSTDDEEDELRYTSTEASFSEILDELVQIDNGEDAKKHADLYKPYTPEQLDSVLEAEEKALGVARKTKLNADSTFDSFNEPSEEPEGVEEITSPLDVEPEPVVIGTEEEEVSSEQQLEDEVRDVFSTVNSLFGTSSEEPETPEESVEPAKKGLFGFGKKKK